MAKIPDLPDLPEWERKPDEPARWYARFEVYRLLGPSRSMEAAYRSVTEGSKRKRAVARWYLAAKEWQWKDRAEAWDAVERARYRAARENELEEAQEQHLNFARLMLTKGVEALNNINPASLSASEARALIVAGVNLEKVSLAEPIVQRLEDAFKALERGLRATGSVLI
jgi:hypothetical protein